MELSELIDALEIQSDEINYYFNKKENKLVFVMDDDYCDIEDNRKLLVDIESNSENYIPLPSQYEINEHQIMVNFANKQHNKIKNLLLDILHSKGAFRKFKDKVFELDIRDAWFEYKKKSLEEIALHWCTNVGVTVSHVKTDLSL